MNIYSGIRLTIPKSYFVTDEFIIDSIVWEKLCPFHSIIVIIIKVKLLANFKYCS